MSIQAKRKPIPVVLDTDIGSDIDDTWALAMMLKSPELDVKLVVSDSGDTRYRSAVVAKMLEVAGRTDVPVGLGMAYEGFHRYNQAAWVEGYDLSDYPGLVYEDGVSALIDTIMGSCEPVTLVCIGPVPNIAEALEREPRIAERSRFVGMHGSIYKGYGGSNRPCDEYNVANHTQACQKVFTADWDITITPLDTCGLVVLEGDRYHAVRRCRDPLIQALLENYRIWLQAYDRVQDFGVTSPTLFDTVAVYLAFSEDLLVIKDLGVRVTHDGYTVVDGTAKHMRVAVAWRDLGAFEDLLVERLTGPS
jgi:inosine-uridine nucleoside N-ribohydrolase